MGTRSDFYTMNHDGKLMWLGSNFKDGGPERIPLSILIQANQIMFEEEVYAYLAANGGVIRFNPGGKWPWPWEDSKLTDYTYIFNVCTGKVLMSEAGSRLVDPIKILQGQDMIGADVGFGLPFFPRMRNADQELAKKWTEDYGQKSTTTV